MESVKEGSEKIVETPLNFFSYVFNFDKESREDMLNIIQYSFLAVLIVVFFNKGMQKIIPPADEDKGTPIILAEVFLQVFLIFIGMMFTHRIISYIPTISKSKYTPINIFTVIIPVLIIILSLKNKIGDKVSILMNRLLGDDEKPQKKSGANVRVSQPISGQTPGLLPQGVNTTQNPMGGQSSIPSVQDPIPDPDFNAMFAGPNTPMPGAATPGMEGFEPMAANACGAW